MKFPSTFLSRKLVKKQKRLGGATLCFLPINVCPLCPFLSCRNCVKPLPTNYVGHNMGGWNLGVCGQQLLSLSGNS